MLLFNVGATYAAALPHHAMEANRVQTAVKQNVVANAHAENNSVFQKDYELTDLDDSEEFDFDEHPAALKEKHLFSPFTVVKYTLLSTESKCKTFCNTVYTEVNFSRLPRYNYISLRVLRI